MKVDANECNDNLDDFTEKDLKVLDDWIKKFDGKYKVVGQVRTLSYKVSYCILDVQHQFNQAALQY